VRNIGKDKYGSWFRDGVEWGRGKRGNEKSGKK
jgi:hypothetical protein